MSVRAAIVVFALLSTAAAPIEQKTADGHGGIDLVTLPVPDTPLVAIRLMFRAGSIDDPKGKEGLAALTALMLGSGGTAKRTYPELIDALYPTAASLGVFTDREVTVFTTEVQRDTVDAVTALLLEALLDPGFREEDLTRNREQLLAYLTTTLRSANDELLGLEMMEQVLFDRHPYGHSWAGTVEGLQSITLADLRDFYSKHYSRANLILGVAGAYATAYPASLVKQLQRLPAGTRQRATMPAAAAVKGREFTLIQKQTDSTGIHFGYPLPITRRDAAFYPLMLANSYLGEHRTFHGRLMQELRGKRGLNYGDYSYIEFWANPPGTTNPPPNHPRRAQYFSVWVRPVAPETAVFALRAAIGEVERLVAKGLTKEEFDLTRDFLVSYSKLWARSLSDRLGFHMDSRFYDMPYFIDHIEQQLKKLTLEDVNRAVKQYLQTENFEAVIVTGNADALSAQLKADKPSPIEYPNPVPPEVKEADKEIVALPLKARSVVVLPVEQTFQSTTSGRR